jgi:hypothetical protein
LHSQHANLNTQAKDVEYQHTLSAAIPAIARPNRAAKNINHHKDHPAETLMHRKPTTRNTDVQAAWQNTIDALTIKGSHSSRSPFHRASGKIEVVT